MSKLSIRLSYDYYFKSLLHAVESDKLTIYTTDHVIVSESLRAVIMRTSLVHKVIHASRYFRLFAGHQICRARFSGAGQNPE